MSDTKGQTEVNETVKIGQRLIGSVGFQRLFQDGMALVEETARYLDNEGREQSKNLPSEASLFYATESMRLTTRLMQMASWLLLQRAVAENEMSNEDARKAKNKLNLTAATSNQPQETFDKLPDRFKELISHSERLQNCILHMDSQLEGAEKPEDIDIVVNPVADQLGTLRAVFENNS